MTALRIINCADKIDEGKDWNFVEDQMSDLDADWEFFINLPGNWLEQRVRKPQLSRYRVCLQTVLNAKQKRANYIISHLPRATCWTALFARLFRVKTPHLAFSFTFTDLPTGMSRKIMSYAFQSVDRFVVYTEAEKNLYSQYFNLDPNRFDRLPWVMEQPQYDPQVPLIPGRYICAVGSEGRDYASLVEAMRQLPDVTLVIVARPYNLEGLEFPANVKTFTNLPIGQFWNIVRFSQFTVLPLRDRKTNCSHISIVGSMMFGKPIVTTLSEGTQDYISAQNALISLPGDVTGLVENIERLWRDSDLHSQLQNGAAEIVQSQHQVENWVRYLKHYFQQPL